MRTIIDVIEKVFFMKKILTLIICAICLCSCDYDANFYSDNINEVKKAIRTRPYDIDRITQYQTTPLIYAATQNRIKALQTLIKNGANINKPDAEGTALWHVVKLNRYDKKAKKDNDKRIEIAKFLIRHGADVNEKANQSDSYSSLYRALETCNQEIAQELISRGAKIGVSELLVAVSAMSAEYKDNLYRLCDSSVSSIILSSMLTRADSFVINSPVTYTKGTLLMSVIEDNSLDVVERILYYGGCNGSHTYYGIDIDQQEKNGRTALMYAVMTGNIDIVRAIMICDPKLELKDSGGRTALMWAEEKNYKDIVNILKNPIKFHRRLY